MKKSAEFRAATMRVLEQKERTRFGLVHEDTNDFFTMLAWGNPFMTSDPVSVADVYGLKSVRGQAA